LIASNKQTEVVISHQQRDTGCKDSCNVGISASVLIIILCTQLHGYL